MTAKSAYERVMAKIVVDDATGCWVFQGARDPNYGNVRVKVDGVWRTRKAHIVVYEHHCGKIPLGKMLLHSCDNPPCCNPEHLSCGSQYANMRDMMERQRGKCQFTALKDLGIEVEEEPVPF